MKSVRVFCLVVALCLVAMLCGTRDWWAQEVTATVTGTVMDTSGAAVAGAAVSD